MELWKRLWPALNVGETGGDFYFAKDWLSHRNFQNNNNFSRFSTGNRDARARKLSPAIGPSDHLFSLKVPRLLVL